MKAFRFWVVAVMMVAAIGCAHQQGTGLQSGTTTTQTLLGPAEAEPVEPVPPTFAVTPDPLYGLNVAMFELNDRLYFWLLKPLATGYRAVFPEPVRTGVRNFFYNLTAPIRIVSCLFQAKGPQFGSELIRFLMNSTVGVLGFGNPAAKYPDLTPPEEDLGQTLGSYGIGNGFYIVWPFLGPSTLRDSVGRFGQTFLNPVSYVEPWHSYIGIRALDLTNDLSFRIGDYESLKEAALDPYEALKDGYLQRRAAQIKE
ncbi:MAG: VacJ family lipoprotein [Desulfobacteraceae bacterium]|nr:VacJ family lipoprotein [Desulfobacteraceae bacterium]